jgi:hypothetical protein
LKQGPGVTPPPRRNLQRGHRVARQPLSAQGGRRCNPIRSAARC